MDINYIQQRTNHETGDSQPTACIFSRESSDPLDPNEYYQICQCYEYCQRRGINPVMFIEKNPEPEDKEILSNLVEIMNEVFTKKPKFFIATSFSRISKDYSAAYMFVAALEEYDIKVKFADYDMKLLNAWHKIQEIEGILCADEADAEFSEEDWE